ncbi:hypothetical protein [Litorilituus lipolyticus]|uniref:Uncharacterized protein n=1 Tax=Litorilituus lipolyticus TaxID=2491017 RepID=A0A502L0H6_9GAMM|nr:hypothetical protein [Litorilituus lipolyticus]TPH13977.1 hypothetical protein EPA86_12755 [Litorilituus lipolyticus]
MNTVLISFILLVALWLVVKSINTHLKQQKLIKVREMLHTERVKSFETDAEPIDINFEMETMEQMMSQSVTTSTTFIRIWHQLSFRLGVFFIVVSLMGLTFVLVAQITNIELRFGTVRMAFAPLFIGIPLLVTNFLSNKYLK